MSWPAPWRSAQPPRPSEPDTTGWDAKAAAKYLDARAEFWSTWPNAARDRGTFCISCHTTLPYAIARPALRGPLGEREPSAAESKILNNLLTRARNWRDIEPFYPDQTRGIPKTSESRAIEAVMNALVLSRRDARDGHLSDDARTALGVMWALQMKTGPNNGAWTWLNFNYEPWESPNSPYFGASLAALAVGSAPGAYAAAPEIQDNLKALRGYFNREHGKVSVLNQLMGLWASAKIPSLLTPAAASVDDRCGVRAAAARRRLEHLVARHVQARGRHRERHEDATGMRRPWRRSRCRKPASLAPIRELPKVSSGCAATRIAPPAAGSRHR